MAQSLQVPLSMRAAVFNDTYNISTEQVPTPSIQDPTDVIVKVKFSGLCGSDLHYYRGDIPLKAGQIMGHEFVGTIVSKGSAIADFAVGDEVISTFTIQCGDCYYCKHGHTGNCVTTNTFGKVGLDGAQAEYVRVPNAEKTLVKKPQSEGDDSVYVFMADIFVTGYYGAKKIVNHLKNESSIGVALPSPKDTTILQIGAGPVGLCAIKILRYFGFEHIVVVDGIEDRLKLAKEFGAVKTVNYQTDPTGLADYVKNELNGIGFDAVLEIVGAPSSIKSAFDSVRMNGFISCLGMAHGPLPFDGLQCYVKSLNISFGRCHTWALFPECLKIFETIKDDFRGLIDVQPSIDDSGKYYQLFEQHKCGKVVFDMSK